MKEQNRKKRTLTQNKALWLFFQNLADTLNAAGYDMKKTLKHDVEIPWTKQSIHDHLWVPIQVAMIGKSSTTEMNTVEPSEIYEVLNRHLGEKMGIFVQWPSYEHYHDASTRQVR